jgi:hypothetical protein
MRESLLKRVLPFTLTFILGAAVGGFFRLFESRAGGPEQRRNYFERDGGRRGCGKRFRQRVHFDHGRRFH